MSAVDDQHLPIQVLLGVAPGAVVSLWMLSLPAFLGAGLTDTCGFATLPYNRERAALTAGKRSGGRRRR